jgi:hypothetical protein
VAAVNYDLKTTLQLRKKGGFGAWGRRQKLDIGDLSVAWRPDSRVEVKV